MLFVNALKLRNMRSMNRYYYYYYYYYIQFCVQTKRSPTPRSTSNEKGAQLGIREYNVCESNHIHK